MKMSKCRLRLSVTFTLLMLVVTWLLLGDRSPLENYFLYNVILPNFLRTLLTGPYLVMMIIGPGTLATGIAYILILIQWFIIGFILSLLICRTPKPDRRTG